MKEKFYTIGEIFRLGLLKNWKGEAYKDKATISRLVNRLTFEVRQTPWGPAKVISEKQIGELNKKRKMGI